jgi:hypothetical protein
VVEQKDASVKRDYKNIKRELETKFFRARGGEKPTFTEYTDELKGMYTYLSVLNIVLPVRDSEVALNDPKWRDTQVELVNKLLNPLPKGGPYYLFFEYTDVVQALLFSAQVEVDKINKILNKEFGLYDEEGNARDEGKIKKLLQMKTHKRFVVGTEASLTYKCPVKFDDNTYKYKPDEHDKEKMAMFMLDVSKNKTSEYIQRLLLQDEVLGEVTHISEPISGRYKNPNDILTNNYKLVPVSTLKKKAAKAAKAASNAPTTNAEHLDDVLLKSMSPSEVEQLKEKYPGLKEATDRLDSLLGPTRNTVIDYVFKQSIQANPALIGTLKKDEEKDRDKWIEKHCVILGINFKHKKSITYDSSSPQLTRKFKPVRVARQ